MARAKRTECPIVGCRNPKQPLHVMCSRHWYQVDRKLRERVWELYRKAPGSDDHLLAVQAAIDDVHQQESARQAE